ncbi:histidine kinase, partial [Acidovorax sp. SD340]
MPHLTLHRKAFIALAALLVALLLIFAGFSRLGLQRGLGPYVAEIELARMDWLAERLQAHHTQTGGWDTLRNQPRLWGQLSHPGSGLRRSNTQGAEGTPPTDRSGSPGTPPELANGNPAADRSMQPPPPPPPDG